MSKPDFSKAKNQCAICQADISPGDSFFVVPSTRRIACQDCASGIFADLLKACEAIRDRVREKNDLVDNARAAGNNDQVYRLLRHLADQIELIAEAAISKARGE